MTTISQVADRRLRPQFAAVTVVCAVLLFGILGSGQPASGQRVQRVGPFQGAFYPPKLVMRHQSEIDLTEAQRDSIRSVYGRAQSQYHQLRLDLQREMQALRRLVRQQRVAVDSAQTQLDRVLSIENRLKRIRLHLMATVKNTLAPEQQAILDTLRPKRRRPPR